MEVDAYLSLGGNVGPVIKQINRAFQSLQQHPQIALRQVSRIYLTSPVSELAQAPFINAACHITTKLPPLELLSVLQTIEKTLGKIPKPKDAPRPIDIDLLLYGTASMKHPLLTLPHPGWQKRLFVLCPLADIAKRVFEPHLKQWIDIPRLLLNHQNHLKESLAVIEEQFVM